MDGPVVQPTLLAYLLVSAGYCRLGDELRQIEANELSGSSCEIQNRKRTMASLLQFMDEFRARQLH